MKRQGLMQKFIWPLFGYYPWECPQCREVTVEKRRANHHKKDAD
jgi:hypothetical protein